MRPAPRDTDRRPTPFVGARFSPAHEGAAGTTRARPSGITKDERQEPLADLTASLVRRLPAAGSSLGRMPSVWTCPRADGRSPPHSSSAEPRICSARSPAASANMRTVSAAETSPPPTVVLSTPPTNSCPSAQVPSKATATRSTVGVIPPSRSARASTSPPMRRLACADRTISSSVLMSPPKCPPPCWSSRCRPLARVVPAEG